MPSNIPYSTLSPIAEVPDMALPQYGFGVDVDFDNLVGTNPFLFRVYTPRHDDASWKDYKPSFIPLRFQDGSPVPKREPGSATYADVTEHMDWTTKSMSPYVSTSFNFAWAMWEAVRRYRLDMKHDIEIAVIDANAVADRAVTALDLLRRGTTKERHPNHWKWYHFALESQCVLVHGSITSEDVLASVPIAPLLEKLPSYLLLPDNSSKCSLFERLGWDVNGKRPSFRQFCQESSDRFVRMPVEQLLRDAASSSVRLSLEFLRSWLLEASAKDSTYAMEMVSRLAMVIARWPSQWWVREHNEVPELLESIVQIVVEEIQLAQRAQNTVDAKKAQGILDQLRQLSVDCEQEILLRKRLHQKQALDTTSTSLSSPSETESPSIITPVEKKALISKATTASCWLTGFFFGTFMALCLFSHNHKRELLLVA